MSIPSAVRSLALIAVTALAPACSEGPSVEGGADEPRTDDLSASLLGGRTDPGLGTGPSVPLAGSGGGLSEAPGAAQGTGSDEPVDVAQLGFDEGSPEAPIKLVEFSDFGCGYCARFHNEVYPTLAEEYIATGKVEWKYVPIILGIFGANAELAARAGECAGAQDGFPAMRDRLFEDQSTWKGAGDPNPHFRDYAREQGLDLERFERCLTTPERDARILAGTRLSRQAGLRGTPTFFILGYAPIPGMVPLDLFRQLLDTVYEERTADGG